MAWGKLSMLALVVLIFSPGCVEFWHKDHGIVHEVVERDRKENQAKPVCPTGEIPRWICPDTSKPESCHWDCNP